MEEQGSSAKAWAVRDIVSPSLRVSSTASSISFFSSGLSRAMMIPLSMKDSVAVSTAATKTYVKKYICKYILRDWYINFEVISTF